MRKESRRVPPGASCMASSTFTPLTASRPAGMVSARRGWVAGWLGLGLLIVAVFGQIAGHGLVNFDDPMYISENTHVLAGFSAEGFRWAWTNKDALQWQPLAWLGHMAVAAGWGSAPAAHLLANLSLHWLGAGLLWVFLARATGSQGRSFAVALLFAVHPANVETAVWASQLKSTLSTVFLLLALIAYCRYAERGERRWYAAALAANALGLLAKPMLVSLPLLLVLLDFWPLRRWPGRFSAVSWPRWIGEKIPFVSLALAGAIVNAVPWGSHPELHTVSRFEPARISHALTNFLFYLRNWIFPVDLGVLYPERATWSFGIVALAIVVLGGISLWVWHRRQTEPVLLVGWGWFVATLLPVSGIVPLGPQAMADRYLYVPAIGLFVALVWTASENWLVARPAAKLAALGAVTGVCAFAAHAQAGFWRDSLTLWQRAGAVAPPSAVMHLNLGEALLARNRLAEAQAEFQRGVQLDPNDSRLYINLAGIAQKRGDGPGALVLLDRAGALAPKDARIFSNRGSLLHDLGRIDEALTALQTALTLQPRLADAHLNLGVLYADRGQLEEAVRSFAEAARLRPGDAAAAHNLTLARAQLAARR